ncbi:MAG TPA: sulfate permease [Anaerolineae bacterium]|nr:sulfate permease [Anaerolineae bacterium]
MSGSNVPPLRFTLAEASGAFGDLATLAPLLVALITVNHLNPTSVFLVVGLAYVLNGLYYRLPVSVQPLKAASATAVALGLSASVVAAAGWLMGLVLLVLAASQLIEPMRRLFTRPIVRGIQLGLGLLLIRSAWRLVTGPSLFPGVAGLPSLGGWPLHWFLALGAGALLLVGLVWRRLPTSLLVLGFGLAAAAILGVPSVVGGVRWGFRPPAIVLPTLSDLATAAVLLVVPQLPLTIGNATIATSDVARRYFGPQAVRVQPRSLLTTMGLSNLLAGFLGGMPICHGSGGLTAHVRFGARTGGAPLLIGGLCLGTALLLDGGILPLLTLFPLPVLGVLLLYVGVQHSLLVSDLDRLSEWAIAIGIALTSLLVGNLAVGFLVGISAYWLPRLSVSLKRSAVHVLAGGEGPYPPG